jgi:thiamine-phosphate pyrophosphorylase
VIEKDCALPPLVPEKALLRILDANLDRAREGIRVVEEWARFALENGTLVDECKALRHELAALQSPSICQSRNTPEDPGTSLSHPDEEKRASLTGVVRTNFVRTQEALRVLEEYGKLYEVLFTARIKNLRYRVYTLEQVFNQSMSTAQQVLAQCRLYLVTSPRPDLVEVVEQSLLGGVRLVQLREKNSSAHEIMRLGRAIRELCTDHGALFILNDRPDLALALECDGVHVGQEDAEVALARRILGPDAVIGRSTHHPTEAAAALAEGADYIGIGPVYATPTKAGREPVGLEYVRYCAEQIALPGFAIGGLDLENVDRVLQAGGTRVAVVRAIMDAPDPKHITQQFLEKLHGQPQG